MGEVMVLCYHAVSPTWEAPLCVTPELLERQLTMLVRRGWRGITFRDAMTGAPFARNLAVTFDDAFASVFTAAYPILASLGLPGTVFAPTSFMSERRPLAWPGIEHWLATSRASELRSMSWEDLGTLRQDGWEIGSHTRTHPRLTSLDQAVLTAELAESRHEIAENLGAPCETIAYPYGDVDGRVADAAQQVGYLAGASLARNLTALGPFRWPRVGVYHSDVMWRFRLKANGTVRRLRASRIWPAQEHS
jgi:peptidoglycan/xylan/chitin deacetylase (PgdA/CDA1 family)